VQAISYTSGTNTAVVSYARNANGQIQRVDVKPTTTAAQATLVSAVTYLPFGPLNAITFGNGRMQTKTYDQNYAPDLISDSASSNPLNLDLSVNSVGNITGLTERTSATTTVSRIFQYDGLDRLVAQKNGATTVEGFSYDATGNRLSKTSSGVTEAYVYPATSHQLTSVNGVSRTYNAVGDLKSNGKVGGNFNYDDDHRLKKLSSAKDALYNALGQRVLKLAGTAAGSTVFVYDEAGHLVGEFSGVTGTVDKQYVWLDETLVGVISAFDASTYQYVETDHLGTPRAIIHPTKNVIIWRWDMNERAFGEHSPNQNPDGDSLSYKLNLRYPGQYYDSESGFNYNYFRDYDPATGRYIESDPIGLAGGTSTYGYVGGNPLSHLDPYGLYDALYVIRHDGTIYVPMTAVKNSAQARGFGAPIGTPVAIAVPNGVDPNGPVDYWRVDESRGLGGDLAFANYWRPGGEHDYKLIDPRFDAFGNFEYGASGNVAGYQCETLTGWGDRLHHGHNYPINTQDIQSGYDAIQAGGTFGVFDYQITRKRRTHTRGR
jgi:RHS repeat-associated protein